MVGSYSQPIKCKKIISYGIGNFQNSSRTAAWERWRLTISTRASSMRTASELRICTWWVRNTFNQNSKKETRTYDSPISTRVFRPCELLANFEFPVHVVRNLRFLTLYQNSSNEETRSLRLANLQWYPPSVQTANSLFLEGTHLGHQNRQTNALNACNKWSVYSTSTRPIHM